MEGVIKERACQYLFSYGHTLRKYDHNRKVTITCTSDASFFPGMGYQRSK